jgi:hypothetical protein
MLQRGINVIILQALPAAVRISINVTQRKATVACHPEQNYRDQKIITTNVLTNYRSGVNFVDI